MAGTPRTVLRIVSAATLVVLVAAGCGSSGRPDPAARGVPRALAGQWAAQASTIAAAAAAGDSCRAHRLAGSLRTEVIAAGGRVPARLGRPLLQAVNSLADRIVCVIPPRTVTTTPAPRPKHEKPHHEHGHHGPGDQKGKQP
jgi:hypothetical protein